MATVTFAQLRTRFDTRFRDSTDTTFSSGEKDEFVTTAINDPLLVQVQRDTSLTMPGSTTTSVTPPTGYELPTEIQVDASGDGETFDIGRENWYALDGKIYIDSNIRRRYSSRTLVLIQALKLSTSSSIPDYFAEYVLERAEIEALEFMKDRLATRFLTNDMTMSDLVGALSTHERRLQTLRKGLPKTRSVYT